MGDIIKDDEFEELHDYESLKNYFNVGLHDIAKELDEENLEKIEKFRDDFTEKFLSHIDVEKKLEDEKNGFSKFIESFESNIDIDPGRLLGLADGIFGMVMTLLVFSMALPGAPLLTEGQFLTFLQSIAHTFGLTIVSLVLVSSFWVYHHEFIKINSLLKKKYNLISTDLININRDGIYVSNYDMVLDEGRLIYKLDYEKYNIKIEKIMQSKDYEKIKSEVEILANRRGNRQME